jgi:hypothetical protein
MRDPKTLHDVVRFDAWPHHHPQFGQLRPHARQLHCQRTLRIIERRRFVQQRGALSMKGRECTRAVRNPPVTLRILSTSHTDLPETKHRLGEAATVRDDRSRRDDRSEP